MYTDSFITEIDSSVVRKVPSARLEEVRQNHIKINDVVNSFRKKVDTLIDKQRNEYILAYENHMQDVQKELHTLREKVAEIANDETKNEKTKELNFNQVKYKAEAIKLESDSDDLRNKMKTMVRKIYTVEKSRDWMLKKLRQAKARYTVLLKERVRLFDEMDNCQLSQASMSNASSYTLELKYNAKNKHKNPYLNTMDLNASGSVSSHNHQRDEIDAKLFNDFGINRQGGGKNTSFLPPLTSKTTSQTLNPWDGLETREPRESFESTGNRSIQQGRIKPTRGGGLRASHSDHLLAFHNPAALQKLINNGGNQENSFEEQSQPAQQAPQQTQTQTQQTHHPMLRTGSVPVFSGIHHVKVAEHTHDETEVESSARGELIAARARKQELRDFVKLCGGSLHKGPWSRVKKRPIKKLLEACMLQLECGPENFVNNKEVLQLVCELAATPETYEAILEALEAVPLDSNRDAMQYTNDTHDYANALLGEEQEEHQLSQYIDNDEEQNASAEEYIPIDLDEGEDGREYGGTAQAYGDEMERDLGEEYAKKLLHNSNNSNNASSHSIGSIERNAADLPAVAGDISAFRDKMNTFLDGNNNTNSGNGMRPMEQQQQREDVAAADECVVADDLLQYMRQEQRQKQLIDSGYYQRDNFMDF